MRAEVAVCDITPGERIREIRTRQGLSLGALAAKAGVSKSYLGRLETNDYARPGGPNLQLIAEALGVDVGYILGAGPDCPPSEADLPADLLHELLMAVDTAHDRWLLNRWATMAPEDLSAAAERIADTLRRLLAPA